MAGALEHANNLSEAFDVDIRPILERAADQQLSARKFEEATLLYRLSKVNNYQFIALLLIHCFCTHQMRSQMMLCPLVLVCW